MPSATRQGTYATTADGNLLTSWNSNDPRFVARKLREALDKWNALTPEQRGRAQAPRFDVQDLKRDEAHYPEGGLVLKINTRDLPRETPQTGRFADAWNQDFAWFTKDEARSFVPEKPAVDETREVPRPLVERLAALHFVDNVRGQTSPFPTRAVTDAKITSRVTAVEGDIVTLRLEGQTKTLQRGKWPIRGYRDMNTPTDQERGVELRILGFAKFDLKQGRFVEFEAVAVGDRWGGTQYNGRGNDLAKAPFGVALSLAGQTRAERVAPEHFYGYGWR